MKVQVDLDVLGSDDFYNKNIGGKRFFRPVESFKSQCGIKNHKYVGPFTITYDNGVEHRVSEMSVREFAEHHGYNQSDLSRVKNGKQKRCKNIVNVEYDKDKND